MAQPLISQEKELQIQLSDAARDVERAVEADLLSRADKKRSTSEIGDDLAKALS